MSSIYLKVTIEKNERPHNVLNFNVLKFKEFVFRSIFGEFQLTEISLNFKTSCCNLNIRGLRANLSVIFQLI